MAIRQSWKFEKDYFGKRHRKYFLENIFGADTADMKTFRALKTKLERDYLGFFESLQKSYQRGEFKKLAKDSVGIAQATISILDHMIDSGAINDKTVGAVVTNIGNLNASKDFFVEKSGEVQALKNRMSQIESETGVSAEALNVSEEVVTSGAMREKKKLKEGALPFLGRTMPKTAALGGELLQAGAAALGPLYPLAQMAGGAASDLFGLGRGISQKLGERKERRLGASLTPMAHALPQAAIQGVGRARTVGAALPKEVAQRKKVGKDTLIEFFNKGAFQAKWTKQLLNSLKKSSKGGGLFGALGLLGLLKGFGIALLPLIGTAGLIAGLGLASVGAADRLIKLGSKLAEFGEVSANVSRSLAKQHELQEKYNAMINAIIIAKKESFEETGKEAAEITASLKDRMETRENLLKIAPTTIKDPFIHTTTGVDRKATILPPPGEVTKIEQDRRGRKRDLSTAPSSPSSTRDAEGGASTDRLSSAIDALTKKLGSGDRPAANIKESSLGDPFDSSDVLLNKYVGADLSLK